MMIKVSVNGIIFIPYSTAKSIEKILLMDLVLLYSHFFVLSLR